MTSNQQNTDALKNLSEKRHALESLIKITVSIQKQQKSLLELSAASSTTQAVPARMMSHINLLKEKIGNIPVTDLLQKLEKIEKVTKANLEQIIQLVEVEPEELNTSSSNSNSNEFSVNEFIARISNFKRHTQTSIGLRLILKGRNVAITPFRLPIPQAELNQHIRTLKQKEKRCIKRVRKDIVEIIKDSSKIIADELISEQMRECIIQIKEEMEGNLTHLDNRGKIDELPTKIVSPVLESEINLQVKIQKIDTDEGVTDLGNETKQEKPNHMNKSEVLVNSTKKQKLSMWQVFKLWLTSPWNVSWSSLKETPTKKRKH